MTCEVCLALEFASDDSLRALVQYQAIQLERLTGGRYEEPQVIYIDDEDGDPEPPAPSILEAVHAALGDDGVFRKPPRVAAPRLLERLAEAGIRLTQEET